MILREMLKISAYAISINSVHRKRVTRNGMNGNHFHAGTPHGILSAEGL